MISFSRVFERLESSAFTSLVKSPLWNNIMGSQLFLRLLSIFVAENKIVVPSHCYQLRLNQDAQPTFQI